MKKPNEEAGSSSIAGAAIAGASRERLLEEALKILEQDTLADRIGIWIEPGSKLVAASEFTGALQGVVWDRGSNADCPPEWKVLSLEPPLPPEMLAGGKPFEQDLENLPSRPLIGQLLGLRRALWVPIAGPSRKRGVILLGSTGSSLASALPRARTVAAELALALEAEDQLRDARIRGAELALVRHFLESRMDASSVETLLTELVAGCIGHRNNGDSLGAAFAAIGTLPAIEASPSSSLDVNFRWRDGDITWTRAIETDPLNKIWRRGLETGQITGSEPPETWAQASVARIVAIPLEAGGQLLGTFVAGLPGRTTSLATLSRLQLRARLAAFALRARQQRQEEARNEDFQQALLDFAANSVVLVDYSGKIAASSCGAKELFGVGDQPQALRGQQLSDLFSGRGREQLVRWLPKVLNPAASVAARTETLQGQLQKGLAVRARFARMLPGSLAAISLEPQAGPEPPTLGPSVEAELQNVIEWLEEGVILFDAQENVCVMNTRFEQIVGLSPEESGKFKTLEQLIGRLEGHAAEPARFAERWRELARSHGAVREQLNMARPSPRVLDRAVRPMLDHAGRQVGRVEIYRDLTAQRAFHSQLLQTEKLAALGQMVSGIAHELSNPLTSIIGYAQRLLRNRDALGSSEELRQIYQEAERAGSILRQLLLNARDTIPERRPVSLNQVVSRALELQRFSLVAEQITVELDLDPALPFVHGDAGQLQQVLMNLMGNARHALEGKDKKRTIHLRTRRLSDRRVLLEVEDNGPGVPQAIQSRIFDPFFTTKPAGVGTGLGLAIVLSVVREHGGQVRLQSPPKGGASFQIEIPAASERQQEDAQNPAFRERQNALETGSSSSLSDSWQARRELPSGSAPPDVQAELFELPRHPRVLVVEDEPTVAQLIADVLQDEGMRVDVILDGREALDRAGRESYDLVICDMKMPGLGGQRFYRSLQRNANPLRERFLFVTGDVMAAQTREFLERHGLPHVAKPFRVEELTEKVHTVLRTRAEREHAPAQTSRKNAARNG